MTGKARTQAPPDGSDLDEMLESGYRSTGVCRYVSRTTPEQRVIIRTRAEAGRRQWTTYQRWLAKHGVDVNAKLIQTHFVSGHNDER